MRLVDQGISLLQAIFSWEHTEGRYEPPAAIWSEVGRMIGSAAFEQFDREACGMPCPRTRCAGVHCRYISRVASHGGKARKGMRPETDEPWPCLTFREHHHFWMFNCATAIYLPHKEMFTMGYFRKPQPPPLTSASYLVQPKKPGRWE